MLPAGGPPGESDDGGEGPRLNLRHDWWTRQADQRDQGGMSCGSLHAMACDMHVVTCDMHVGTCDMHVCTCADAGDRTASEASRVV